MKDPWDQLEIEMRAMPLEPLSPEIQQRVLRQLAAIEAQTGGRAATASVVDDGSRGLRHSRPYALAARPSTWAD